MQTRLGGEMNHAAGLQRQLRAVGPISVLQRGFSVSLRADGTLIRRPQDVSPGASMLTKLADGEIKSTVAGVDGSARVAQASELPAPILPKRRGTRKAKTEDGPGLWG
jgi:exonuclease VII large subunit